MKIINLDRAVSEILQTCDELRDGEKSPFFYIIGAGVSAPTMPLASEIEEHCKQKAAEYKRTEKPKSSLPMDTYSHWFEQAYSGAKGRQNYLRDLIKDKQISPATLRLAHILSTGEGKKIGNIVITPNFDDFLSRSLTLFGASHILCDHPKTTERINPEAKEVQIVHVHGTYWFYDCCNLKEEVMRRAEPSQSEPAMVTLLDELLTHRAPIVVGYSGWEEDVITSALCRRLSPTRNGLPQNIYWFCHRRDNIGRLPSWLKDHSNVTFVALEEDPATKKEDNIIDKKRVKIDLEKSKKGDREEYLENKTNSAPLSYKDETKKTLKAQTVFDKIIQEFGLEPPLLTSDSLGFFANQLEKSFLVETIAEKEPDIYSIAGVIEDVKRSQIFLKQYKEQQKEASKQLAAIKEAVSRSQYKEAIQQAQTIDLKTLSSPERREFARAIYSSCIGLSDNSEEELQGYNVILDFLSAEVTLNTELRILWANALFNKGVRLGTLNRSEEEIVVYDEVIRRFGEATGPVLREGVARALVNKGYRLGALNRSEEEIVVYDEVIRRFGEATGPALREQVAKALFNKGYCLGALNRSEEEIVVYDEVTRRFGEATEPALREQVANALINKGYRLGTLNRSEEAIAVNDEVIKRFGEATEPALREQVAKALFNKGYRLGALNRFEEEIVVYDEVIKRFGEATEPVLREGVARALVNKGYCLGALNRSEEEIVVYDEVIRRFGEATEPVLREGVARALVNKGYCLGALNRSEEAIVVYDEVIRRFGEAIEPALREGVAKALVNKGYRLGALNRSDEEIAVYDEVIKRFGEATEPALRERVAKALFNKGITLGALNRSEEAIVVYDEVIRRFGEATEPALREQVKKALVLKKRILEQQKIKNEEKKKSPPPRTSRSRKKK